MLATMVDVRTSIQNIGVSEMQSIAVVKFTERVNMLDVSEHDANTVVRWFKLGNIQDALDMVTLWESIERVDAESEEFATLILA
jgi:hypothetical protein